MEKLQILVIYEKNIYKPELMPYYHFKVFI
jgi:hypothetical protein